MLESPNFKSRSHESLSYGSGDYSGYYYGDYSGDYSGYYYGDYSGEFAGYYYGDYSGDGYYDNSLNQVDMIQVAAGKVIKIEFTAFNVENDGPWCPWDHLSILDGNGNKLLDKACGFRQPFTICSETNEVYFTFFTDCIVTRPGWRAERSAETECSV